MLRLLSALLLCILSSPSCAYASTIPLIYDYDANVYFYFDQNIKSDALNNEYDGTPNLRNCCNTSLHVHDNSTGLTYMGARYYDPLVGRFMGMDPAGVDANDPRTFNRYAYANNSPYMYVDPDGRSAVVEIIGGVGVLYLGSAMLPGHEQRVDSLKQGWKAFTENSDGVGESAKGKVKGKDNARNSKGGPPRDESGNYVPDPDAEGAHTTLGTRKGRKGSYTQGATFDKDGEFKGRTDVTDHGRGDHDNPHWHPAKSSNSVEKGSHKIPD